MNEYARKLVWDALLNAEYLSRYYAYLARRLELVEQVLAGAVILLSSGALAALFVGGDAGRSILPQALSLITALIGVYLFSSRPGRIALLCAAEAHRWRSLIPEYELLWSESHLLGERDLLDRWSELERRAGIGGQTAPVEFPMHRKLVARAQQEVMRSRHLAPVAEAA